MPFLTALLLIFLCTRNQWNLQINIKSEINYFTSNNLQHPTISPNTSMHPINIEIQVRIIYLDRLFLFFEFYAEDCETATHLE